MSDNYIGRAPGATADDALSALTARVAALEAQKPFVGAPVALAGTFVDFAIPPWVTNIILSCAAFSTNGVANPRVQLGDAGGIENAGYISTVLYERVDTSEGVTEATAGFEAVAPSAAQSSDFSWHFTLVSPATNLWFGTCCGRADASVAPSYGQAGGGRKALTQPLTTLRLTTANGVDLMDGGTGNISYW